MWVIFRFVRHFCFPGFLFKLLLYGLHAHERLGKENEPQITNPNHHLTHLNCNFMNLKFRRNLSVFSFLVSVLRLCFLKLCKFVFYFINLFSCILFLITFWYPIFGSSKLFPTVRASKIDVSTAQHRVFSLDRYFRFHSNIN